MEVVHTCPDVRQWSEVLCSTIPTHISDLEVEVKDFMLKSLVKMFRCKAQFRLATRPVTPLILDIIEFQNNFQKYGFQKQVFIIRKLIFQTC